MVLMNRVVHNQDSLLVANFNLVTARTSRFPHGGGFLLSLGLDRVHPHSKGAWKSFGYINLNSSENTRFPDWVYLALMLVVKPL